MLRAVQNKGRGGAALAVGNGADELETLAAEENFSASVAYFPERYGNYLIPLALLRLGGKELPAAVTVNHVIITPANICEFYSEYACNGEPPIAYTFPQEAFAAHLAALKEQPELAGYQQLIPDR